MVPAGGGWFELKDIDLAGVKSVNITLRWQEAPAGPLDFEIRSDASDGKVLGKGSMPAPRKGDKEGTAHIQMGSTSGNRNLYFVYAPKTKIAFQGAVSAVEFNAK